MERKAGIGIQIASGDPFWVMVHDAAYERAGQLDACIVSLDLDMMVLGADERLGLLEELLAQDLDALVIQGIDQALARPILNAEVPMVVAIETDLRHHLATSPSGLADIAQQLGRYIAERLGGRGHVLIVGGMIEGFERGRSRLEGCRTALAGYPDITVEHIPTPWFNGVACDDLRDALPGLERRPDAVIGLSDSLALATRDLGCGLGLMDDRTLIAGFNGDPLAVAAIMTGTMTATADISAHGLGSQLVDLAYQAAQGQELPLNFSYQTRLVTADNVAAVAAEKLMSMAALPSRLVGFSEGLEQRRLTQLQTSQAIGQRIGSILDRDELRRQIADEIRVNYGYDEVCIFLWSAHEKQFASDCEDVDGAVPTCIPLSEAGLLAYTLFRNRPTFIPDAQRSSRFSGDPLAPDCRSRVIVPIHVGKELLGLLDLRSRHSTGHSQLDLIGLQILADQLGVAMRNADLYESALADRAAAERASQIKTRLLANVSHELRTPINIIQGYSQSALGLPNPYGIALPPDLIEDLKHILASAEHLGRLINDLIDMSRAEIDELEVIPVQVAPAILWQEVFAGFRGSLPPSGEVEWRLELPAELPMIHADPLRLRQILLNLLSNAAKFTADGHVSLGCLVEDSRLHLWVEDTGCGIAPELREHLFEAFAAAEGPRRAGQGISLGLRLTAELIRLHGGTISVASQEKVGTTVHIYLPLLPEGEMVAERPALERPLSALNATLPSGANHITRLAIAHLREHFADDQTRGQVAELLGVSESYLTRVFGRDLGFTPWEYLSRFRIERAKDLLASTDLTITHVANRVGYNDAAYFTRVFHKETGQSPLAFRRHTR